MRGIGYRAAATAFVFTGLWFTFGVLLFVSGLPSVLGIGRPMFVLWLLLFFVILGISGMMLIIASFNGLFSLGGGLSRREPAGYAAAPARTRSVASPSPPPPALGEGRTGHEPPLPWSASPLPDRGRRPR
jgi:hypothetical protein